MSVSARSSYSCGWSSSARTVGEMSSSELRSKVVECVASGIPVRQIEAALVQRFLNTRPASRSTLLTSLMGEDSDDVRVVFDRLAPFAPLSLDDVVQAFESLVPAAESKAYGAVFTPEPICRFMAQHAISHAKATSGTVIDPACGCGALLVAALRRIHALSSRRPRDIVAEQLFGVDISVTSVERARILFALACVELGDDPEELRDNLMVDNALTKDWGTVPQAPFDVVLANPPYVRYQHLPVELREELAARWQTSTKGNFNLYYAFFELAAELVKPDGFVAYITPNNFFTTQSAGALREWMTRLKFPTQVIDFGSSRVFNALTYTAITFADRGRSDASTFGYATVEGVAGLELWKPTAVQKVKFDELSKKPWMLVAKGGEKDVRNIAGSGTPLSEVAHLRCGVKTLRDRLYIVPGAVNGDGCLEKVFDGSVFAVEAEATRSILRMSDLMSDSDVEKSVLRIIYPYDIVDGRAVVWSEEKLYDMYPLTARYLSAVRDELRLRDKGNKVYPAWFAYGRSQGLVAGVPQLVSPEYASRPRFLHDVQGSLLMNGVSVQLREGVSGFSLRSLAVVLNSGVCRYFVESTARCIDGGFFAYQKPQLSGFGVVRLDERQLDELVSLPAGEVDDRLAEMYDIALPSSYRRL